VPVLAVGAQQVGIEAVNRGRETLMRAFDRRAQRGGACIVPLRKPRHDA